MYRIVNNYSFLMNILFKFWPFICGKDSIKWKEQENVRAYLQTKSDFCCFFSSGSDRNYEIMAKKMSGKKKLIISQ